MGTIEPEAFHLILLEKNIVYGPC